MAEEGFDVHGPHDHALEHAGHHDPDGLGGQLAVITALLATVGAMFSYMGGATQADAGLYKNTAAIKKTAAADQWGFYQAKSAKQNLAELAAELVPAERKAAYLREAARYQKEKAGVKAAAEALDQESETWEQRSEAKMHQHHRWAQATTALQVAIAMAAITLLTRRNWLRWATIGVGVGGVLVGVLAWFHL